jgi:hypothetical protein
MNLRFVIVQETPGGKLWLSRPSQSRMSHRLELSKWTSVPADAYRYSTIADAMNYLEGVAADHPTTVEPVEVVEADDRYSISKDPVVPNMIVEETRRSQPNPKTGKTRITYRGIL